MARMGSSSFGRALISGLAAAALLSTPVVAQPAAPKGWAAQQATIDSGRLQGAWADAAAGVRVFRGIPYAAPPVGRLRWRAPMAPAAWSGVRSALDFGTACWQDFSGDAFVWSRGEFQRSEDCLYLNVWTAGNPVSDAPRPVMVWFHGGAHTGGYGHSKVFDGTALARHGVVLVSINYRLGPLGFLAHEALAQEAGSRSSGNYGLHDKVAALQWVRRNIAAFGGDPQRVTVFGQSAGASSVCHLMVAPAARGLFHRAIGQSAACFTEGAHSTDLNGRERGAALVLAAGLDTEADATALRQLTPQALLAAARDSNWGASSRIVVDGVLIPEPPAQRYAEGRAHPVPLLVGSMANEGVELLPLQADLDHAGLVSALRQRFGARADALLNAYAESVSEAPGLALRDILTDQFMAWAMRHWARASARAGQPTWLYFFELAPPAFRLYLPHRPDLGFADPRAAGAYHSGDLAYVFGTVDTVGHSWQARDRAVSEQLLRYWTRFAATGNPNGPDTPNWPPFTEATDATLIIGAERTTAGAAVRREKLDLLEPAAP